MKKILILSVFAVAAVVGCKKKETAVSTLHSYSAPTILLPGGQYFSMMVGEVLPAINATAYDSFYNEDAVVVYDQSKLDNTVPGLYIVTATAKNRYGMAASKSVYVAVTDVPATALNLAGSYLRVATNDTVSLMWLANGFYMTNDVAGNGATDLTHVVPAYFVQTSSTTLEMPAQDSKFGTLYGDNGIINISPTDTSYSYVIRNSAFAPTTRTFKRLP